MPDQLKQMSDLEQNQESLRKLRLARAMEIRSRAEAIARQASQTVSGGNYSDKMIDRNEIEKK